MNDTKKNLSIIILAAGKGKRMKSETPKVLHQICFKPIIYYILKSAEKLNPKNIFVVVGHKGTLVEKYLTENFPSCRLAFQENQLGTAHAVKTVLPYMEEMGSFCMVIPGDVPMITIDTLKRIFKLKLSSENKAVLLTAEVNNPYGYGRIMKGSDGNVVKIVEETDASALEKKINEINSSIYCFDTKLLFSYLHKIDSENSQNEFYLTDIVEKFVKDGHRITSFKTDNTIEIEGINDRVQLANLERTVQQRINEKLALSGVTIRNPETSYIDPEAKIGRDTIIEPFCFIKGRTKIGDSCVIGPFTQIENCIIGSSTKINKSVLQDSQIGSFNNIGPTSYIRPGTITGNNVKIGACCEIKKSRISDNSKVPHLSYIGDAEIGSSVNIGAGTITCNYDGFFKNKTIIEDNVFIGSDTMLVAPVKVGRGAITAAGSSITDDVPPENLAVERTKQVNIDDGAIKFREKKQKQKIDKIKTEDSKK